MTNCFFQHLCSSFVCLRYSFWKNQLFQVHNWKRNIYDFSHRPRYFPFEEKITEDSLANWIMFIIVFLLRIDRFGFNLNFSSPSDHIPTILPTDDFSGFVWQIPSPINQHLFCGGKIYDFKPTLVIPQAISFSPCFHHKLSLYPAPCQTHCWVVVVCMAHTFQEETSVTCINMWRPIIETNTMHRLLMYIEASQHLATRPFANAIPSWQNTPVLSSLKLGML